MGPGRFGVEVEVFLRINCRSFVISYPRRKGEGIGAIEGFVVVVVVVLLLFLRGTGTMDYWHLDGTWDVCVLSSSFVLFPPRVPKQLPNLSAVNRVITRDGTEG